MSDFDPNAAGTGSGIYGLPHTVDEARVVLVPVPFEATPSYGGGTEAGPEAIATASHQVDLFDHEDRDHDVVVGERIDRTSVVEQDVRVEDVILDGHTRQSHRRRAASNGRD